MSDTIYFAVGNDGTGEAIIKHVAADEDYREQDITGPHRRILYQGPDRAAALTAVEDFERHGVSG